MTGERRRISLAYMVQWKGTVPSRGLSAMGHADALQETSPARVHFLRRKPSVVKGFVEGVRWWRHAREGLPRGLRTRPAMDTLRFGAPILYRPEDRFGGNQGIYWPYEILILLTLRVTLYNNIQRNRFRRACHTSAIFKD